VLKGIEEDSSERDLTIAVKDLVMMAPIVVFILLYVLTLVGWIKPLENEKLVTRIEPIIFVIIGYYFGRLPSQQNEKLLKDEVSRQTQRADAAQHAKEQAQQVRETMEEKVKGAKRALASAAPGMPVKAFAENLNRADGSIRGEALQHSAAAAISILDS
jgi:hypothetical protein